jgi:sugar lactone lactonase YvrE
MIGYALALLALQTPTLPKPKVVARFPQPMVTGVAVSKTGRLFLTFPRWEDPVDSTLMEWKAGKLIAYPNAAFNRLAKRAAATRIINAQSAYVDDLDRLWVIDTGSVKMAATLVGGPKLLSIDLATNKVLKTYALPPNVALPTSYLNDVRIDTKHGKEGFAIITDSSTSGPNGLVVVNLETGESSRRLNDHPSTKADPTVVPIIDGKRLVIRPKHGPEIPVKVGSDGLAIDATGDNVYYCPMISRHLYRVSLAALTDPAKTDADVLATLKDLGEKGISDGIATDTAGNLFVTDVEANSVKRLGPDGTYQTVMRFSKYFWVDSIAIQNGDLYATGNELHRLRLYNKGSDLRRHRNVVAKVTLGP